jgi:hypothetical protein
MTDLDKLIAQKNRETTGVRRQQFARKSSDSQMLDHLVKAARVAVDSFFADGRDCREAMKELRSALVIAERRKR